MAISQYKSSLEALKKCKVQYTAIYIIVFQLEISSMFTATLRLFGNPYQYVKWHVEKPWIKRLNSKFSSIN